ncbi:MAG: helix-turn-helix transcriptional regulator [Clostridia bacterium]|nr:helix-turn-helix transcriptional regulator [Clostridia bacterium]
MKNEFAKIINTGEIKFKYAKGMRDIVGKEIHKYHEIFFFLGGDAVFTSERGKIPLIPYTAVIIPKDTFHCFTVMGEDSDYVRCVFNFDEVNELDVLINKICEEIRILQSDKLTAEFRELSALAESDVPQTERNILLKAFFARLLTTISLSDDIEIDYSVFSPLTTKALKVIAKNRDTDLSSTALASELRTSVSHLEHVFKRDMNVSLHRYVLEKRLIWARQLIQNGAQPTSAAASCGFGDYSGFYRQYKKHFGTSPSASAPKDSRL